MRWHDGTTHASWPGLPDLTDMIAVLPWCERCGKRPAAVADSEHGEICRVCLAAIWQVTIALEPERWHEPALVAPCGVREPHQRHGVCDGSGTRARQPEPAA